MEKALLFEQPQRHSFSFHLRTLWLFTYSDLKSVIIPWTIFGLCNALAGPAMTTNASPDAIIILTQAPRTLLWSWLVVLILAISNQRSDEAIEEDTVNKPWRPLPSQRLTSTQARNLLLALIPLVYAVTWYIGAREPALLGFALTWMYNDLRGAEINPVLRNLLNALGLGVWSIGTTHVACSVGGIRGVHDGGHNITTSGYLWLLFVGAIIFTTGHVADFRDEEGDRLSGRRTIPLVMGDARTRYITAALIVAWSVAGPLWWTLGLLGFVAPLGVGLLLAGRLLALRTAAADGTTWKLWGLWMATFFVLPLCSNPAVFSHIWT